MKRTKKKLTANVPSSSYEGTCCIKMSLLAVILLLSVWHTGCTTVKSSNISDDEKNGIKVESVRISSAGYMLDFRYRVIDKAKAEALFTKDIKPYVIHQKTNARLIVPSPPKVGSLSQTSNPPVEGKIYFVIFANPGRLVKSGDKITVVMNDLVIKDVVVN